MNKNRIYKKSILIIFQINHLDSDDDDDENEKYKKKNKMVKFAAQNKLFLPFLLNIIAMAYSWPFKTNAMPMLNESGFDRH